MLNFTRGVDGREIAPSGITAVPTGAADLVPTGKKVKLMAIYVFNNTAGALNLTLSNGGGATTYMVKSCPANDLTKLEFVEGCIFPSGLRWVASGSGLLADVVGFRET
jgi:hypothetical protein